LAFNSPATASDYSTGQNW